VRPLDPMGIGADLSRNEPVDADGMHPAGKRFGVDPLRVESAAHLLELIFPGFVIQMWCGREHRNFQLSTDLLRSPLSADSDLPLSSDVG
jgi:hypothetical protein